MSKQSKNYKGRILFVDDSKVNLMLGNKMLGNFGFDVSLAENGKQAIALCKTNKFQLVFMDLEMPEIGGLAAATIIREEKLSYAPIYALTGTASEEIRLLCRAAHMNGFIEKPLKQEKLAKILDKVLFN